MRTLKIHVEEKGKPMFGFHIRTNIKSDMDLKDVIRSAVKEFELKKTTKTKLTSEKFEKFLKTNKAWAKFNRNYNESKNSKETIEELVRDYGSSSIMWAFSWDDSPEHHLYWKELDTKLGNLYE